MLLKNCSRCKVDKEIAEGSHRCKDCESAYRRELRLAKAAEAEKAALEAEKAEREARRAAKAFRFEHPLFDIYKDAYRKAHNNRRNHRLVPLADADETAKMLDELQAILTEEFELADAEIHQLFYDTVKRYLTIGKTCTVWIFCQDVESIMKDYLDKAKLREYQVYIDHAIKRFRRLPLINVDVEELARVFVTHSHLALAERIGFSQFKRLFACYYKLSVDDVHQHVQRKLVESLHKKHKDMAGEPDKFRKLVEESYGELFGKRPRIFDEDKEEFLYFDDLRETD